MRSKVTAQAMARATGSGVLALVIAFPLFASPANAAGRVSYPKELHGFWIPEGGNCPAPGQSYDGDQMMDITASQLRGYEEVSKPTKVTLLSKAPKAWKIESLIDIGPSDRYEKDVPRIFVLNKWTLAAVDEANTTVFKRCQSGR
ncbi:hypothetical protein [Lysobacter tyrosinilyticus]